MKVLGRSGGPRCAQVGPKWGQVGPKLEPSWAKLGLSWHLEAILAPRWSKIAKMTFRMRPQIAKIRFWRHLGGLLGRFLEAFGRPRCAQDDPGERQDGPRWRQEEPGRRQAVPRRRQDDSKTPQKDPKSLQEAPKRFQEADTRPPGGLRVLDSPTSARFKTLHTATNWMMNML